MTTAQLDAVLARPIRFPDGVDPAPYLRGLRHSAWSEREWTPGGARYRRMITCSDEQFPAGAPVRFAITYFSRYLRHGDGPISLSPAHLDMVAAAARWAQPAPQRVGWVLPRDGGKALALDTPVLTENRGWTTHGDLVVGDRVFDETGASCRVVALSPRWQNRPCYRLTFSDGEQIVADANHEWPVNDRYRTRPGLQTTEEIAGKWLLTEARGAREVRYSIDTCGPLQYPAAELPIPPYVLGAWLGDGTSRAGQITVGDQDVDALVTELRREGEAPNPLRGSGGRAWMVNLSKPRPDRCPREHRLEPPRAGALGRYRPCRTCTADRQRESYGTGKREPRTNRPLIARLRALDLLQGKHIPEQYLIASVEQRLALLQGLMDTDGSVAVGGRCEFTGTSERLCCDVLRLAQSLGIKATIREGRAVIGGVDKGPKWRVAFCAALPVFRLPRKAERIGPVRAAGNRRIVNVEKVEPQTTSCIEVDSSSHLSLAGRSLIPTHNSVWLYLILPAWAIAHGHRRSFLSFSLTKDQAEGHLANLRAELDPRAGNALLLADFPDLAPERGAGRADRAGKVTLQNGATVAARGLGAASLGTRTGTSRPDLIIGDDLEPDEADHTPEKKKQIESRLVNSVLPMGGRNAVVHIAGTTTMVGSLMHDVVRAALPRDDRDHRVEPWIAAERFVPCYWPAILDEHTDRERSLWPQRWTLDELRDMRENGPQTFALNYRNRPESAGARGYWTPELIRYDRRIEVVRRILSVDPAMSNNRRNDKTAVVLLGLDASGHRAVVEYAYAAHLPGGELLDLLYRLTEAHPETLHEWLVETQHGGDRWETDILVPRPPGVRFIRAQGVSGVHKRVRIEEALSHYQRRAVAHREPLQQLEDQQMTWTPAADKDDLLDALANGLRYLFGSR